jgi:hypothetical protein
VSFIAMLLYHFDRIAHLEIDNLYYVVYTEGWKEVEIFDHDLNLRDKFAPIAAEYFQV